jgi:hypothetical protein
MNFIEYSFLTSVKNNKKKINYFHKYRDFEYKKNLEIGYLIFNCAILIGIVALEIFLLIKYVINNKDLFLSLQISICLTSLLITAFFSLILILPIIYNLKVILSLEELPIKEAKKQINGIKDNDSVVSFQETIIKKAENLFNTEAKKEFFLIFFNYCKNWYSDEKNSINTFYNIFQLENDLCREVLKQMSEKLNSIKENCASDLYEKKLENFKNFMILQFFIIEFSIKDQSLLKKFFDYMKERKFYVEISYGFQNQITKINYEENKFIPIFDNFLNQANFNQDIELNPLIESIAEFLLDNSLSNDEINSCARIIKLINDIKHQVNEDFLINFEKKIYTIINFFHFEDFFNDTQFVDIFNEKFETNNEKSKKITKLIDIFQFSNQKIQLVAKNILNDFVQRIGVEKNFLEESLENLCNELSDLEKIENYRQNLIYQKKNEDQETELIQDDLEFYNGKNGVFWHNITSFVLKSTHDIIERII